MMRQLVTYSGTQGSRSLAMEDAYRRHAGHGCIVEIRIQLLQCRLDAPAAHIELQVNRWAIFQAGYHYTTFLLLGSSSALAHPFQVIYADTDAQGPHLHIGLTAICG